MTMTIPFALLAMLRSTPAAHDDSFTGTLGLLGLALPCIAFAWDGLVRRQLLLPDFPVGATLGAQALRIRRLGGLAIGLVCLLASIFFLLASMVFLQLAIEAHCRNQNQSALACTGALAGSAEGFAWVCFGICLLWFVIVWLRLGNPYKHVLVYGVWYHQEKVARQINRQLRQRGLAPLPHERLYALEESVLQVMRAKGWLVYGEAWLDGGRTRTPVEVPLETMVHETLQEPAFQSTAETESIATELLLTYFHTQAQRAQHMSPFHRWWVGTGQRGKLGVYGRRAI